MSTARQKLEALWNTPDNAASQINKYNEALRILLEECERLHNQHERTRIHCEQVFRTHDLKPVTHDQSKRRGGVIPTGGEGTA